MLGRISRNRITSVVLLTTLAGSLGVGILTVLRTQSGPLMLVWIGLWSLGAGIAGSRLRDWLWPALCPAVMLVVVMAWEVAFGRTSWASLYVFMLGVIFAVAAAIGAVVGTWFGKRRARQGLARAAIDVQRGSP